MTTPSPSPSARGRPKDDELRQRRHDEILEVAVELFAARGYAGADTQLVADRLGVGKGTIYRYFPSKEALFLAAVDLGMRRLRESVDAVAEAEPDPLRRIAAATRAYLTFFEQHPELVELLMQERAQFKDRKKSTYFVHRDQGICKLKAVLAELIGQGLVREVSVDRLADVFSQLLYGTMFTHYFTGREKPLAQQTEDLLDVFFHGILTAQGLQTYYG
ncbi:MAG: TetR/AcrR family transcriptional regulator [Pirellulales bacterium]